MPAITAPVIEPLTNALSTPDGWIGLLLGLLGREAINRLRRLVNTVRGGSE